MVNGIYSSSVARRRKPSKYPSLKMNKREATAITHAIIQEKLQKVEALKQGRDYAEKRHKRRKFTTEEKLKQLDEQEARLKQRLQKLKEEKHYAFAKFREMLSQENEEKEKREMERRQSQIGESQKEGHKSSILSDIRSTNRQHVGEQHQPRPSQVPHPTKQQQPPTRPKPKSTSRSSTMSSAFTPRQPSRPSVSNPHPSPLAPPRPPISGRSAGFPQPDFNSQQHQHQHLSPLTSPNKPGQQNFSNISSPLTSTPSMRSSAPLPPPHHQQQHQQQQFHQYQQQHPNMPARPPILHPSHIPVAYMPAPMMPQPMMYGQPIMIAPFLAPPQAPPGHLTSSSSGMATSAPMMAVSQPYMMPGMPVSGMHMSQMNPPHHHPPRPPPNSGYR